MPVVGTSFALPALRFCHSLYGSAAASNCTVPFRTPASSTSSERFVSVASTSGTSRADSM